MTSLPDTTPTEFDGRYRSESVAGDASRTRMTAGLNVPADSQVVPCGERIGWSDTRFQKPNGPARQCSCVCLPPSCTASTSEPHASIGNNDREARLIILRQSDKDR